MRLLPIRFDDHSPPSGEGVVPHYWLKEENMIAYENHCTGCSDLGLSCLGQSCPNIKVPVFYCDNRKCVSSFTGTDRLFKVGESQLCMDCIVEIADRNGVNPEDLIEGEV